MDLRLGRALRLLGTSALFALSSAELASAAAPRERTFIMAGQADGPTFRTPGVANPYSIAAEIRSGPLQLFEPLFYYNVYQDQHIPWLATGYEYGPDNKTLTVKLRPGVEWSDGQRFTAEDVVFTLDLLRQNGSTKKDMKNADNVAQRVERATAVDDLTVRIDLKAPDPRFIFTHLTNHMGQGLFWLPKHIWSKVEDPASFRNFDLKAGLPVTTSAWRLVESTPSQNVIERRDDWWGAKTGFRPLPATERVIGIPFGGADRGAQLISSNAVDITMDFPSAALLQRIISINPKVRAFSTTADGKPLGSLDWWPTSLYFNHKDPMWADTRLRRAVAYAVNRPQIIAVAYNGANEANLTPFPAFKPLEPSIRVAEEVARKHGYDRFDLAKSAALMQEMGYAKNGAGLWQKDGKTVKATIHGVPPMVTVGPVVAQQLRNAGFDLSFVASTDSRSIMRQGKAQMMLFGHFGSILDPAETLELYHCRNALEPGQPTFSMARWCNEEYSALVDEVYKHPPGDPKILDLVRRAMDIWYDEVVEVPLNQWFHRIPMNETYWTNYPTAENPYLSPAFWYESGQGGYLLHNLKPAKN